MTEDVGDERLRPASCHAGPQCAGLAEDGNAQALQGRELQHAHAVAVGGFAYVARDARRQCRRWRGHAHLPAAADVQLAEWPPDGEGDTGHLDVEEQGLAIR